MASLEERATRPEQRGTGRGASEAKKTTQPNEDDKQRARDKQFFEVVLLPLYDLKVVELVKAWRNYQAHLIALECLRATRIARVDGHGFAQLVKQGLELLEKFEQLKEWWDIFKIVRDERNQPQRPPHRSGDGLTIPDNPRLNGIVQYTIEMLRTGAAIVAALVPLLGRARVREAAAIVGNEALVPKAYQESVGTILTTATSPETVEKAMNSAKEQLKEAWNSYYKAGETTSSEGRRLGLL